MATRAEIQAKSGATRPSSLIDKAAKRKISKSDEAKVKSLKAKATSDQPALARPMSLDDCVTRWLLTYEAD
jgi:hypothetical protein